jgi:hypothetical protein
LSEWAAPADKVPPILVEFMAGSGRTPQAAATGIVTIKL